MTDLTKYFKHNTGDTSEHLVNFDLSEECISDISFLNPVISTNTNSLDAIPKGSRTLEITSEFSFKSNSEQCGKVKLIFSLPHKGSE